MVNPNEIIIFILIIIEKLLQNTTFALLTTPKPLTVWITTNWEILQEMRIPDHLICILRNLCAGQEATVRTEHGTIDWFQIGKQQLELDMEQQTGSKLGKEYIKAVYCHPVYLAYIQNTSYEMLGWMKHKLELRLLGEISITSDMQMTQSSWQKVKKN